jgi:hypothetical protein
MALSLKAGPNTAFEEHGVTPQSGSCPYLGSPVWATTALSQVASMNRHWSSRPVGRFTIRVKRGRSKDTRHVRPTPKAELRTAPWAGAAERGARESPARRKPGGACCDLAHSPFCLRLRDQMRLKVSPSSTRGCLRPARRMRVAGRDPDQLARIAELPADLCDRGH